MAENMVGETGFEPATLCSQSQQEPRISVGLRVKLAEYGYNGSGESLRRCKISSAARQHPSPIGKEGRL